MKNLYQRIALGAHKQSLTSSPFTVLMLICSLLVYLCPITFLFPVTSLYDYVFSENGLVAYKNGELIHKQVSVLPPPVNLDIYVL